MRAHLKVKHTYFIYIVYVQLYNRVIEENLHIAKLYAKINIDFY